MFQKMQEEKNPRRKLIKEAVNEMHAVIHAKVLVEDRQESLTSKTIFQRKTHNSWKDLD